MKYNLKNFPKQLYTSSDSLVKKDVPFQWYSAKLVTEWLEGFNKDLRAILDDCKVADDSPMIELLLEILGENSDDLVEWRKQTESAEWSEILDE